MIRLLIFFLFISFWSTGQIEIYPQAPNLTTANLKGSVRSIEEKSFIGIEQNGEYVASHPGWEHAWQRNTKSTYDSRGNLIKVDSYESEKIVRSDSYIYKNFKLIECILEDDHRIFEYDSLGRVYTEGHASRQEATLSGSEAPFDRSDCTLWKYVYDASGKLIAKDVMVSNRVRPNVDSIFYDDRNRPIKILSYYPEGVYFQTIKYDPIGNVILHRFGDDNFGLCEEAYFFYKANGLFVKKRLFYRDKQLDQRAIWYYENGNEIKFIDDQSPINYRYITESSYSFDEAGNWVRRIISVNNAEKVYVVTRTIEYYE